MPLYGTVSPKRWSACLWLVAFWAGVAAAQPAAATSTPATPAVTRVTAATPSDRDALSTSDFWAIVAEARKVPTNLPPDGHIALPKTWHTLTREKLAAMLTMPLFGDIPHGIREVLIDQAATWDLFDFKRPSDAAALWGRVWSVKVVGRSAWDFFSYIPDGTWSPTSLAMASIFECFPKDAWTSRDPIVSVVTKNLGWEWDMGHGGAGMRECLPDIGTPYVHWTPQLRAKVSAILTRKFTDELREDGCTRHGVDSCLVVFQALYGLDPHNPDLPALLKKIEPAFFGNDVPLWQSARNDSTPTKVADVMHKRLIQRMAFITTKLPVLLEHPHAWPAGATEHLIAQALQTAAALTRLWHLDYSRYYYHQDRDLIAPWRLLQGKYAAQVMPAMQKIGRAYARTEACQPDFPLNITNRAFKDAYIVENIRLGNGGCGLENQLPLAELVTAKPARRKQLIALLKPIAGQLSSAGPLREQALIMVTDACRSQHATGIDPFGLCAAVRARDAAARAAKLASMPPVDPLACPEGTLAKAEQTLSVEPEGDDYAACRKNPSDTSQAIVALAYLATDGDKQDDNGHADYDLDLAIVDIDSGRILAHRHEANGIESDAVSLDRVWLDTSRYDLAPGRRAFGVRSRNDAHCWQCAYGETTLSLYLLDGKHLRKLLTTTVAETNVNETGDHSTRAILCIGKHRHHGLADIVMSQGPSCQTPDGDSRVWRYDGQRYQATKPAH